MDSSAPVRLVLDCTDSTNNLLKKMALDGILSSSVVISRTQSSGRGRLGRTFSSPEGGLYMSVLVDCPKDIDNVMMVTAKAAVAVRRAIREVCKVETRIKWVNDLYLNGKKVCGILCEMVKDRIVIGVGLNYCTRLCDLPQEIQGMATSLYDGPRPNMPDMLVLADRIRDNLVALVEEGGTFLDEYRNCNIVLGKNVDVIQAGKTVASGLAKSIDDRCFLHVEISDGELVLSTGEVSARML